MNRIAVLAFMGVLFLLWGCARRSAADKVAPDSGFETVEAPLPMRVGSESTAMPRATAFRMSGDYASNVAVTVGDDGKLLYYPAPGDITPQSAPLNLGDGWWLNRQGLGPKSVFTRYTFEDYSNLSASPSPEEILRAVIPGARVTEMRTLPYPIGEAEQHLAEIKKLLAK